MKRKPAYSQGFTLIEVLMALIILSIGVTSIFSATSSCLAVIKRARAMEIADGLIVRVDIENPIESVELEEMSDSGRFDDVEGYTWQREITMDDEENRPGLFLVRTRIQWSDRGKDAYEEVVTYRYAPDAESVTSEL